MHSPKDIKALRKFQERNAKVSEELANQPTIPFSLEWVWEAFWFLCSGRGSSGFGPVPILLTEIEAYSRIKEMDAVGLRTLVFHVRRMDDAWLVHVAKKSENDDEEEDEDGEN